MADLTIYLQYEMTAKIWNEVRCHHYAASSSRSLLDKKLYMNTYTSMISLVLLIHSVGPASLLILLDHS